MDRTADLCDLCGLPTRFGVYAAEIGGARYRFCCNGCRQVFRMLIEASDAGDPAGFRETDLFRQCVVMGIIPASESDLAALHDADGPAASSSPADGVGKRSAAGNSPESSESASSPADLLPLTLKVNGMWCPACAWLIDASLKKEPGVAQAATQFSTDRLFCRYDPVETSPDAIIQAVRKLGYEAAPAVADPGGPEAMTDRREMIRFGLSAFFTMNVMMLSFALYHGFFTEFDMDTIYKLSWPIFGMACVPFFYGGSIFHRRALSSFRTLNFSMETLISVAASSAFFYSVANLIVGSLHLYFDTAAMLITLTLLGKLLERNAKDRVIGALEAFLSLEPGKVKLRTPQYPNGRYVDAAMLRPGDVFIVAEGEIVPADAPVLSGTGTVDESALTGEPTPLSKKTGDRLISGSRVVSGEVYAKADAVGDDATLGRMLRIIERSLGRKTAFEGRTDRLLRLFVPAILLLAVGTGVVGALLGLTTEAALVRAITVMVISCPCALGIAIPLARVAGISLAGNRGILVREFSGVEKADRIDTVVFDKTGTLTEGRFNLLGVEPTGDLSIPLSADTLLGIAAGLESGSDHPFAWEIRRASLEKGIPPEPVAALAEAETGVSGALSLEGKAKTVAIGSAKFIGVDPAKFETENSGKPTETGVNSRIYLSVDGRCAGVFRFGDRIAGGAANLVTELGKRDFQIYLLSGDAHETTRKVADAVGIAECRGGMLPADKADFIARLRAEGRTVVMVGDGINDAPAMAAADVSVAVYNSLGAGNPLGREFAEITLMRAAPEQFLLFLDLARRVNRKIAQNLFCTSVYNLVSIPIAMSGLLTPLVAVIAMLLSSLSVIGNTLLLVRSAEDNR